MSNFKLGPYFKMNPSGKEHDGLPNELEVFSATVTGYAASMEQTDRVIDTKYLSSVAGAIQESALDDYCEKTATAYVLTDVAINKFKYIDVYVYASVIGGYGGAAVWLGETAILAGSGLDSGTITKTVKHRLSTSEFPSAVLKVSVDNDSTYSGYTSYSAGAINKIVLTNK